MCSDLPRVLASDQDRARTGQRWDLDRGAIDLSSPFDSVLHSHEFTREASWSSSTHHVGSTPGTLACWSGRPQPLCLISSRECCEEPGSEPHHCPAHLWVFCPQPPVTGEAALTCSSPRTDLGSAAPALRWLVRTQQCVQQGPSTKTSDLRPQAAAVSAV